MADVYRAKEPFAFTGKNGVPRVVTAGDLMTSDDPDFKGKEHFFEAVEVAAARARVEDTSAEPGTLRSVTTPKPGAPARGPRKATSAVKSAEDK